MVQISYLRGENQGPERLTNLSQLVIVAILQQRQGVETRFLISPPVTKFTSSLSNYFCVPIICHTYGRYQVHK